VRGLPLILLWSLSIADSGCATIYTLSADRVEGHMYEIGGDPQSWPRFFSGVAADGYCIGRLTEPLLLCLVDLPLSLAADLVVSPYKAYQQIAHGNYHPRCIPERQEEIRQRNRRELEATLERCRKGEDSFSDRCALKIAPDGTVTVPLDWVEGPVCPDAR
jgi:uncharacterized protein YceK